MITKIAYLKNNNTSSFIACRQKIAVVIEFHTRNHIGVGNVVVECAFDLWETPTRFTMTCNGRRASLVIERFKQLGARECKHNHELASKQRTFLDCAKRRRTENYASAHWSGDSKQGNTTERAVKQVIVWPWGIFLSLREKDKATTQFLSAESEGCRNFQLDCAEFAWKVTAADAAPIFCLFIEFSAGMTQKTFADQ